MEFPKRKAFVTGKKLVGWWIYCHGWSQQSTKERWEYASVNLEADPSVTLYLDKFRYLTRTHHANLFPTPYLVHLGTSWYILVHLGTSWYILVHLGTSWYILVHLGTSWYILVHLTFQQVTLQKTRPWTMMDPKFGCLSTGEWTVRFWGGKNGHIEWNTQTHTHTHTLCGSNIEIYIYVVVDTQMLVKSWFWINGSHSVFAHVA